MPSTKAKAAAPKDTSAAVQRKLREHYSGKAVDHMLHPRNMGRISRPAGYGKVETGHNESVEVFLDLEGETVSVCKFETDGCAATLACASAATEMASGKSVGKILASVTAEAILRTLDGLPAGNIHCAGLAAEAVRAAACDALGHKSRSWKRMYRRF